MRVRVQIGPVFVGLAEKVSGGHVYHRPCCREGGCCSWVEELLLLVCWDFVFILAKEEVVSKSADAT
jgi:hypothetical protein